MVEEFNKSIYRDKSKFITIGLIVFNFILYAVIFLCLTLLIAVERVNADTFDSPKYVILNSPSYGNVPNKTCYQNECPEDLIGTMQVYQQANFYWDYNFKANTTYEYQIQGQVITNTQIVPNSSNIGYVFRFLSPSVVNITCTRNCETNYYYRGTTKYIDSGGVTPHTRTAYIYEVNISGEIDIGVDHSSFGFNVNIGNIIWGSTFSYAVITDKTNDTQSIIDNQNKSTDKLIKAQEKMFGWILDGIGNSQYLQSQNTQAVEDLNNDIMDDTITSHTGIFGDIDFDSFGSVSGIITLPLATINSILNSTCTELVLPLPYVNEDLILPCMSTIYSTYFGAFFTLYQTIIFGITAYWVCLNIFKIVKGFADPMEDRIEVLDL